MKKRRFSEEQIIGFIKQAEAGITIKETYRKGGFSDATSYKWRAKFGGMDVPDARKLRELESENAKFKKLLHTCNFRSPRTESDASALQIPTNSPY